MNKETEMPKGTDGSELHSSTEAKTVLIEHKGKLWEFKFVELNWKEKLELASEIQEQQTNMRNGVTTTVNRYFKYLAKVYNKCVRGAPDGFLFDKCDPEFGEKLIAAMPGVGELVNPDDISEADLKN
jgi:hypothetical protein